MKNNFRIKFTNEISVSKGVPFDTDIIVQLIKNKTDNNSVEVVIRKNIATILFANIALSYICTCLTVYKCNIEKEMKRVNRLSLKSQNSYIKYFVIFCISVLLLLEVAMEFLHAR